MSWETFLADGNLKQTHPIEWPNLRLKLKTKHVFLQYNFNLKLMDDQYFFVLDELNLSSCCWSSYMNPWSWVESYIIKSCWIETALRYFFVLGLCWMLIQVLGRESLRSEVSGKTVNQTWSSKSGSQGRIPCFSPWFLQVLVCLYNF